MKSELIQALEQQGPFNDGPEASRAFDITLGVHVPALQVLEAEITSDLDEELFGIGWWSPGLSHPARANIADYLLESVVGTQGSLADAGLHLRELEHAIEENSKRILRAVDVLGTFKMPKTQNALELVWERRALLHSSGFFRAIGSALDLFATSAVGVLAVPLNIVQSDLGQLRNWFKTGKTRLPLQDDFGAKLEAVIADAGPPGWADWVASYRNMLVHRARRAECQLMTPTALVLDSRGRRVPRVESVELLVRDPGLTNADALRNVRRGAGVRLHEELFLTEATQTTLNGLLESATFAVKRLAPYLVDVWTQRRSSPALVPQPLAQWKDTSKRGNFTGYSPGSVKHHSNFAIVGSPMEKRLRASGTMDSVTPKPPRK